MPSYLPPYPSLHTTFHEGVCPDLVEAIRVAYGNAAEQHAPDMGSNEHTFGFNVYYFVCYELERIADSRPDEVQVRKSGALFRLKMGEYEVA